MTTSERDTPQGEQAYQSLIDAIAKGELPPGTRLREVELSERLGLSRTPVREALRALEADGIVHHQPRQGAVVRQLDHAEVMELYEMRAVLEGTAARLAARMASEVELRALTALNDDFASAKDPAIAAGINRRFHRALFGAARNRFLTRAVEGLEKTLLILGPTTMLLETRVKEAAAEHTAIIEALQARNGPEAELLMRNHIEAAQLSRLRLRDTASPTA
ncbi:GntR family transcriptional regulator [Nitratireductor indicus]|uniref:GntR family transcriptional regulator n=1 Tax=Nitratireductor indicus C115 TaxID=1231190 RepID=K2N450_9HYPH|nr:GntR family transcriptional regulator [Nitratireductor indicus]EKF42118.1 GntR family transcriptional regulator [Nitratireductor indicus C115]MDS1136197.1 GntR family transcriptional regulator [Nitratireductor indicus]SFQ62028.1 DNA-binding transcriptional regulator, GntR family [Nitratireductor indicus]